MKKSRIFIVSVFIWGSISSIPILLMLFVHESFGYYWGLMNSYTLNFLEKIIRLAHWIDVLVITFINAIIFGSLITFLFFLINPIQKKTKGLLIKKKISPKKFLIVVITVILLIVSILLYKPVLNYMLYNAVFKGNVKRCSVLLSLGANDIDSNLWLAARWGHIEIVKLLILKDGDVNYKLGGNGDSILEAALDNLGKKKDSNYDVIKYLLDKGANLNLELFNGQNLLQIAIREEDVGEKIILLLIDKGADLNHKDNSGATPLHYACEDEYLKEIAVYLINKGANVNIRDNKGRSPIFNAIEFCDDLEMIKILVENGAEFELIDKNGITPLNFAKEKGRNDVVNFFIEKLTLAGKNK